MRKLCNEHMPSRLRYLNVVYPLRHRLPFDTAAIHTVRVRNSLPLRVDYLTLIFSLSDHYETRASSKVRRILRYPRYVPAVSAAQPYFQLLLTLSYAIPDLECLVHVSGNLKKRS